MSREELEKKLAQLESVNDQLVTEIENIDLLMRKVGFTNGIQSVKGVAQLLLKDEILLEEGC